MLSYTIEWQETIFVGIQILDEKKSLDIFVIMYSFKDNSDIHKFTMIYFYDCKYFYLFKLLHF